jgi:Dihaem cytochrome c
VVRGDARLRTRAAALLGGALLLVAGCGPSLPDPDTPGARVLAARCGGCHRVYAPGLMTADMWRYQVDRMRTLFAQRGIPWLSPDDERALLDYVTSHAGGS